MPRECVLVICWCWPYLKQLVGELSLTGWQNLKGCTDCEHVDRLEWFSFWTHSEALETEPDEAGRSLISTCSLSVPVPVHFLNRKKLNREGQVTALQGRQSVPAQALFLGIHGRVAKPAHTARISRRAC